MTTTSSDDTTTAWHAFLSQQGAVWQDGQLRRFEHTARKQPWLVPLEHQKLLAVSGPDAEQFLQGQLTCDTRRLASNHVLPGAHCDHKGRMHSSFFAARLGPETVGLRLHSSVAESGLAALQKYAVFSKTKLAIASDIRILALLGAGVEDAAHYLPLDVPLEHGQFAMGEGLTALKHSQTHIEIWVNADRAEALWQDLAPYCSMATPEQWDLTQIELGIGQVRAQTAGEFIPQMLNFQHIGAISFDKGCYTGQEVVARMHYLGKSKKHMYRAQADYVPTPEPGTPLYQHGSDKSIGQVVMAAVTEENHLAVLAVCPEHAVADTSVTLASPSGPTLQWQPLPYSLD